jgi:hypothetical protein
VRPQLDADMQALMDETMEAMRTGEAFEPLDESRITWERRRENELTPDYLGRVCEWVGLVELARNARAAHYDDYFCPPEIADGMENMRFLRDLRRERAKVTDPWGHPFRPETVRIRREQIDAIDYAYRKGEFDATKAESDRWAASEAGQSTFRELTKDAVPKVGRNEPCPCGSGRKYKRCHGE